MAHLVDLLFGCWHKNYSFPITQKPGTRRSVAAQATGTYVVCLDCGKEFAYDWKQMKVLASKPHIVSSEPVPAPTLEVVETFAASNRAA
jgi:hypothetical protein